MQCDDVRSAIADRLQDPGILLPDPDLDAHLAECAACRAFATESADIWARLGDIRVPAPNENAKARFQAAVSAEPGITTIERRRWTRPLMAAAGLILSAAIGYGAATMNTRSTPPIAIAKATDSAPQFLILLYSEPESNAERSPAQVNATIAEYAAWARSLAEAGKLVTVEKLHDDPGTSFGAPAAQHDSERLGGFFLIRARNLDEARRIAAECPHVRHGGRVELRAIQPT